MTALMRFFIPLSGTLIMFQEFYDCWKLLKAEPDRYSVDEIRRKTRQSRIMLGAYLVAGTIAITGFCVALSRSNFVEAYTGILLLQLPIKVSYHVFMLFRMKAALPMAKIREVMES